MNTFLNTMLVSGATAFGLSMACQGTILAEQYTTDFTSSTGGFVEGAELNDNGAWLAQSTWATTDVAGSGFTSTSATFQRAVNFGGAFSMNAGDSVSLNVSFNALGDWDLGGNPNIIRVGLDEVFDPGVASPSVGAGITAANFNQTLRLRTPDFSITDQVTAFTWADATDGPSSDSDQMNWIITITKSNTADTFEVATTLTDIEGSAQGSANANFTIVDATLYAAGTLYPVMQTHSLGNDITGVRVDSFTVGAIPEPTTLGLLLLGGCALARLRYMQLQK